MTFAKDFLISLLVGLGLALPFCLPWLLARTGINKNWFLARFIPGITFSRAIYLWPATSFLFLSFPVAVFFQGTKMVDIILATASVLGIVTSIYMVIRTPRWAKPHWVLQLEDHYSQQEIRNVFIPAWRTLKSGEWSKKMDTPEGIEEMVAYARQWKG